jgi:hypothetical protein
MAARNGPRRYAEGTAVSPDKSLAEIRKNMQRWKAEGFLYSEDPDTGHIKIGFRLAATIYRFNLPMPKRASFSFASAYEAEVRRRWRVMAAYTKALLFGTEEGLIPIKEALMPYAVLQGGLTLAEMLKDGSFNKMLALPERAEAQGKAT